VAITVLVAPDPRVTLRVTAFLRPVDAGRSMPPSTLENPRSSARFIPSG
jgi:hypothetical protein